ncbi:hypothetical protein BFG60_3618 [Microcystis aeruginosa NIES-98]|nr:hypothetical protein BFG60_3618 [Microcystis aeruginosa NIES-98]
MPDYLGDYFIYSPHTPHPTPCPHEKLFQQTLIITPIAE